MISPDMISKMIEETHIHAGAIRESRDAPQIMNKNTPTRSMAMKAPPAMALTGLLPQPKKVSTEKAMRRKPNESDQSA
jgi:hypothetical protein